MWGSEIEVKERKDDAMHATQSPAPPVAAPFYVGITRPLGAFAHSTAIHMLGSAHAFEI